MRVLQVFIITAAIAVSVYFVGLTRHDNRLLWEKILPEEVFVVKNSELTVNGILAASNRERALLGIAPLIKEERLSLAAEIKLDNMLEYQYFAHRSPWGKEADDLVALTGYNFIVVGENLANGNFQSDDDLVASWMNSPGHRESILNPGYMEIGIAVREGNLKGHEVWIAVQIFALPGRACPGPDQGLLVAISTEEKRLAIIKNKLEQLRTGLEAGIQRDGEIMVEYNSLVSKYNAVVDKTRAMVGKYNSQVRLHNECIAAHGF